ncbi:hypothetical protein AQJ91_38450 [Streptomyces dysideae]|uniref:Uncharacterized protein n=1 Tax=Streptomyces dysideae TaxID=909626 RepID=A0A117RXZ6_9ACTN|nr:hypothetical protein AQJ91_38450 [Streptomyces dysideae]
MPYAGCALCGSRVWRAAVRVTVVGAKAAARVTVIAASAAVRTARRTFTWPGWWRAAVMRTARSTVVEAAAVLVRMRVRWLGVMAGLVFLGVGWWQWCWRPVSQRRICVGKATSRGE